jgi:hypothetical protein
MSLGYDRQYIVVNLGDTAELTATIYDSEDQPYSAEELLSVTFHIKAPDGTKTEVQGSVEEDGTGRLNFQDTTQVGHYTGMATFRTENGKKSAPVDFETIDPFDEHEGEPSPSWVIATDAWEKFEDAFDSEEGGPWLRDMTLSVFNKTKMENFIDDALIVINFQNPETSFTMSEFVSEVAPVSKTSSAPILTQALVLQIIRHLMRSYVEQPNPVGAQISWHDRRDYLQRWQLIYTMEQEAFKQMLALWKRQFLGLGYTSSLVSSKAGRLLPAPMRTRSVGRGYW